MKILVDENISHRLIALIDPPFEGSIHVNSFSPPLRTDNEIWKIAQEEDYVILTFDEDFSDWQLIRDNPPKVIWLRMGNTPTRILAAKPVAIITMANLQQAVAKMTDQNTPWKPEAYTQGSFRNILFPLAIYSLGHAKDWGALLWAKLDFSASAGT